MSILAAPLRPMGESLLGATAKALLATLVSFVLMTVLFPRPVDIFRVEVGVFISLLAVNIITGVILPRRGRASRKGRRR